MRVDYTKGCHRHHDLKNTTDQRSIELLVTLYANLTKKVLSIRSGLTE